MAAPEAASDLQHRHHCMSAGLRLFFFCCFSKPLLVLFDSLLLLTERARASGNHVICSMSPAAGPMSCEQSHSWLAPCATAQRVESLKGFMTRKQSSAFEGRTEGMKDSLHALRTHLQKALGHLAEHDSNVNIAACCSPPPAYLLDKPCLFDHPFSCCMTFI